MQTKFWTTEQKAAVILMLSVKEYVILLCTDTFVYQVYNSMKTGAVALRIFYGSTLPFNQNLTIFYSNTVQ